MRFENQINDSIDRRNPGEHPVIVEMHPKAVEVLKDDAIDPKHFYEHFGQEAVEKDKTYIERLKAKFENDESKKAAEVLEAIIYLHSELSEWLGPNVETIRPTEYDDIVNKVDLIAEFNSENSPKHLALGVDVTFGSNSLMDKINGIKNEIDRDELAKVKYFESHGFIGSLRQVPRVVVGVEKDTVIELAGLWMRKENKQLGDHPARNIIMTQIIEQLTTFRNYAEHHGKVGALKSYNQALETLKPLQAELKALDKVRREFIQTDKVYQSIHNEISFKFSK